MERICGIMIIAPERERERRRTSMKKRERHTKEKRGKESPGNERKDW